jgi:4-amino-4-deoxy-L-arabinose transferase-like glycosyltransferase
VSESRALRRRALAVITVAALLRIVFGALIPLFPDETYYWDWSRRLAPGYFDHPGGIAVAIRFGTMALTPFGGEFSALAVRLGSIVCGWIAAVATVAIADRLSGPAAALRCAIALSVLPLAAAGLILATPDAPLLAATAAGLYCVVRAFESSVSSPASLGWWTLTGLALGVAFCSKYTSIFLPVGVVIAILSRASLRERLREPGPYIACVVATLVFAPVLIWNAHHDWISFLFQVKHGLAKPEGSALRAAWRHEGDFFGGQAGLASPILFIMLGIATFKALRKRVRHPERSEGPLDAEATAASSSAHRGPSVAPLPQDDARFILAVVAVVSFGFFVYSALRQRVEPNWPATAYIPAIALLATAAWGTTAQKWLHAGIVFAAVMSVVIYAQGIAPILPLAPRKDPIARAFGWSEMTQQADTQMQRVMSETHAPTWLGGDRYQEASVLAFYTPSHPRVFSTNFSGRPNQYDLWPRFPDVAQRGDNLVIVVDDSDEGNPHEAIRALSPFFTEARRGALAPLRRGAGEIGTRRVWTLVGWRGGWPAPR